MIVSANLVYQVQPGPTSPTPEVTAAVRQRIVRGFPTRTFRYAGRRWRLFKRSNDPDASWYCVWKWKGEDFGGSLFSSSLTHAETQAKVNIDAFLAGQRTPRKIPALTATLDELFAAVDRLDMMTDARGRKTYVWGARKCFAFALGTDAAGVGRQPLSVVNGETGAQFFTRAIAHALTLPTQAGQNKFKRQARGWFNLAKALFAADAVRSLPACGLPALPPEAVEAFRKSKPKRFKVARQSEFIAPEPAVLRATLRQWVKLGRTPGYAVAGGAGNSKKRGERQPLHETARRNMFLAVGLMVACGLRKNEVRQIRWRHLTRDAHGVPRLIARDVKVKKGDGVIEVKPLDPFWRMFHRTIDRHGWRGAPDDFVLAQRPKTAGRSARSPGLRFEHGGHSDRTYWPFYHIGKWLRSLGWNLQKTNHALRDCAASLVTMKFGLMRAKLFCRHGQLATTESHYSRFVREEMMDEPKRLAWLRWAK